jgi:hypothetical protein
MTATNRYKVPQEQWRRWTTRGRQVFNYIFGYMRTHPELFLHPKAPALPAAHWRTVAWNAAWLAAGAAGYLERYGTGPGAGR